MSKNKFIRALKVMCVLAPILFGVLNTTISYIGSAISISGVSTTQATTNDNGLINNANNWYDESLIHICEPLIFCVSSMSISPILSPIYETVEWSYLNFFGLPFQDFTQVIDGGMISSIFPLFLILIIFWYLAVELFFFIPEVIILFIRWCKNLMYSFTRKGGFDV